MQAIILLSKAKSKHVCIILYNTICLSISFSDAPHTKARLSWSWHSEKATQGSSKRVLDRTVRSLWKPNHQASSGLKSSSPQILFNGLATVNTGNMSAYACKRKQLVGPSAPWQHNCGDSIVRSIAWTPFDVWENVPTGQCRTNHWHQSVCKVSSMWLTLQVSSSCSWNKWLNDLDQTLVARRAS